MKLGGDFYTEQELKDIPFRHLGENVKIHNRASIYGVENISIGNNVRIDDFSILIATHPMEIGSYVHIANFCFLGGSYGIALEDFSGLSPGAKIFSSSDDYTGEFLTNPTVPREMTGGAKGKVTLKKHAIIGCSSVILPGCTVGEGSSVGAMSLVVKDIDPWGVYFGIPVRRMKRRKKSYLIGIC